MEKVGILTWHYYANFGSGLQAFALQQLISSMGYEVHIINYRNPQICKRVYWKWFLKKLMHNTIGLFNWKIHNRTSCGTDYYQKHYLCQTKSFDTPEQLAAVVADYRLLVYGSDQIWAPNVYSPIYMGKYVPEGIGKISYAASIGLNEIPEDLVGEYQSNLSSFRAVSVRELEGKELLKRKCNIDATVVLDPTLMIETELYLKIQRPVKGVIEGSYIYCYFLNKNHQYKGVVEEYARRRGLQIVGSSDKEADASWMNLLTNLGADQFLWLMNNAACVFTDSYHGTIFSLLFHKRFWTFMRFAENDPICQNSRIRQLKSMFDIGGRILPPHAHMYVYQMFDESAEVDYSLFEEKLSTLRLESKRFLQEALK